MGTHWAAALGMRRAAIARENGADRLHVFNQYSTSIRPVISPGRYREPEWREGRLCLLMELCDGGCVATLLRAYGALRWNIVARSVHAHADAHAHEDAHAHASAGLWPATDQRSWLAF